MSPLYEAFMECLLASIAGFEHDGLAMWERVARRWYEAHGSHLAL